MKNVYEKNEFGKITEWKAMEPSVISKIMGTIFKPVSWLIQTVIPESTMRGAIQVSNNASKFLIDNEKFKKECNIREIAELKKRPLNECDDFANEIHNWAVGYAATEGGVTGATGIIGMAVDIPAIITLAFRTINKIGLCYGYENKSEEDNQIILSILSAAGANTMKEKQLALLTLKQLEIIVLKTTWKKMAQKATENELTKEAGIIALKNLAKQLGINLTKRKALQVVPIIGAAVGASVNGVFINDIAWAARRVFQERWIIEKYKEELVYDDYINID
ncbi:ATPase [Flavobacterium piscis]|nr:ATPase [Flavobacterium piscis]